MGRAVYLNQRDARDIRNLEELLREQASRRSFCRDEHSQAELFLFFRRLVVRLDKAGNKTKPWQPLKGERRG